MVRGVSRKGAMELSMNTIVVVVIGITLLVLGLVFVRGIFTRLGGLGGSAFQKAETELQQIQSGETKINFPQNVEVKKGKSSVETIRVCNTDGTLDPASKIRIVPSDFPTGLTLTFTVGNTAYPVSGTTSKEAALGTVGYQECRPIPTLVKTIPGVVVDPTKQPFVTITVYKDTSTYHSMGSTIEIL